MKKLIKKRFKSEKGQAMVEFALILPILLLIICGIIDFGWMFYNQLSLDNACREGARYSVVNSDIATTQIEQHIKNTFKGPNADDLEISIVFSNQSNPADGYVNVTLVKDVVVLTPVLSMIVRGTTKTLVSTVIMKVET